MVDGYTVLNDFRYERKFVSDKSRQGHIDILLRNNPALFREVYQPRQVNNIYFDTPGLDCYYDNLFGVGERWKARIRWYGEVNGEIAKPVLELKIKNGHLGTKKSWLLSPISFHNKRSAVLQLKEILAKAHLPEDVKSSLTGMQPVLVNNYQRSYFISASKKFRLTIDSQLEYRDFRFWGNPAGRAFKESDKVVVELKYSKHDNCEADTITNSFPFRLNKNSKFVTGMAFIRPGVAE